VATTDSAALCRGAFPLQHASLVLTPRHGGGYAACLARGALALPSDPAFGRDVTSAVAAAAAAGRGGLAVPFEGEGAARPWDELHTNRLAWACIEYCLLRLNPQSPCAWRQTNRAMIRAVAWFPQDPLSREGTS